jgi:hypothetical protein
VAPLGEKIQTALDEARILILGTQVLLGFEYRSFFEARFAGLPEGARLAKLAAVSIVLLAFALMVLPGAYHRIAAGGEDRPDVHRFATVVLGLASLGAIAIAVVLLVTTAAYHRIVERGEETEGFLRVASRLVVGALVAIALGLCGELYVVSRMVLRSDGAAVLAGILALCVILGLWFGLTLAVRVRRDRAEPARRSEAHART